MPSPTATTVDPCRYTDLAWRDGGGIGDVFTANDTELHRTVVVKRLKEDRAHDGPSQRRFLLEAEVTARARHNWANNRPALPQ